MVLTLKNSMGGIDELQARLGGIKCPRETRRRNSRDRHVTHTLTFHFSLVAGCLIKMGVHGLCSVFLCDARSMRCGSELA